MLKYNELKNKIIILRADLNDSIEKDILISTDRIDASISSIKDLLSHNNKIILISHLSDSDHSLLPVADYIKKNIGTDGFEFLNSIDREEISIYVKNNLNNNNDLKIIMLENLRRFDLGVEEKADNIFSKWLSSLGEYFVFDAFSVAHREHASVIGVSQYLPHCLGPIAIEEEKHLQEVVQKKSETLFIIGGAKISTKLSLIDNLLKSGSSVYLGGAMANTILYLRGVDVKNSKIEKDIIIEDKILNHKNLIIPQDYIWGNIDGGDEKDMILDIGDNERNVLFDLINKYNNIIWNGPMGLYEKDYYSGTDLLIELLNNKPEKIIITGGGDTLTCIYHWQEETRQDFNITYKSLSGGAMLIYLEKGTLIGLDKNR